MCGSRSADEEVRAPGASHRVSRRTAKLCLLILGILVAFVLGLAVAPLYPGGIRMGRWRVWGYADEVAYTDPGPLLELDKQQLRRRPLVWDPNGPEIQVGPDLPWREGGEYRLIVGRWQYWLRIEAPSGRYEIAPPLP